MPKLSPNISTLARSSTIDALEGTQFDLVVIGGGITGAGIARDAAMRGMAVALVEAEDFASGTSSRSSKLIHGGLRYLERGEINLVRKTALERKEIHQQAPHLCEPRHMVIPLGGRAGLYALRIAVTTYERLGAVDRKDAQETWSGSTLADNEPLLNRKTYPHALAYREYLTDDARLVIANMRSAVAFGAQVINHAPAVDLIREQGRAAGVVGRCSLSGREFRVRGKVVVNAAGPWVEAIQRLENPDSKPLLHLSKGIHIVIPASKLPIRNLLVVNTSDKRRIFALRRGEVVYIGTTDTTYEPGAEVWPTIDRADVEYLLAPLASHFTGGENIGVDDVIGAWAGLRPLIADPLKKNPSELSRRDELLTGPLGVISVAGGKLTGYRGMARRVLQSVVDSLDTLEGVSEARFAPISAADEPRLPGGDFPDGYELHDLAGALAQAEGLGEGMAIRLTRLYGTEAAQVLAMGREPIYPDAETVTGEARWAVEREGAATLEDLFYRRTRLPLFQLHPERAIVSLARHMGEVLAWDQARVDAEIAKVEARLADDLAFKTN